MSLKTKFLLFGLAVHGIFVFMLASLYPVNKAYFFIGEALLVASVVVTLWFYKTISRLFDVISSGIETLKDRDFSTRMNLVGHREVDELISVYNMMIEQLRQERLQQIETSNFLSKLIDASPTGIVILDFEGNITSVNRTGEQILRVNKDAVKGLPLRSLPGRFGEDISTLEVNMSRVITLNGLRSYKCNKSTFIDRGNPRAFITIEEMTREIYLKEKNAYEKVIKMMSHEVNNSIGAVNSMLNSCLNYSNDLQVEDRDDYENALRVSIGRNKALSDLMSDFARVIKVPEPVRHPADVCALLRSVIFLMEPQAQAKQIEWITESDTPELTVMMDSNQIEQVFINILKNAIEAVDNGGRIIIRTSASEGYVSVSNTGPGIPPELIDKLFTPFFSTKRNGHGVGLMLTREILYNHGFTFSLESNDGLTEFRITV